MNGADVVCAARSYIGCRWSHQGRSRQGLDCLGLIIMVAREVIASTFDTRDYSRQATDETMLLQCREHLTEIQRVDLRPGDVVVMRFSNQRHIGILGNYEHGGFTLIHAYSNHPRRVVEHRLTEDWLHSVRASIIGTFRFPGITQ